MYIYLCSKVFSGKKIFNGINERDFFIQETGSPGYFGKQRKYSRGIFYRRYTPLLHTGVDAECTRVFYLQLQPWFSLPAALPEPANDRISLTYPVVGRLSLSLSPSPSFTLLSLSPANLRSSNPPLFDPLYR